MRPTCGLVFRFGLPKTLHQDGRFSRHTAEKACELANKLTALGPVCVRVRACILREALRDMLTAPQTNYTTTEPAVAIATEPNRSQ